MTRATKRKSRFKGTVSRNSAKQRQGRGAQHLRLPKGVSLFKEQPKTRVKLDIIPYIVTDEKHPDRDDEFGVAIPGEIWYKRPYLMHKGIGPNNDSFVCPRSIGKRCPVCEYRDKELNDGADWNDDHIKALKPSQRNLYVVIPREHKDYEEVPHIWDISQFLFQDALNEEIDANEDYETFPDLEEGYTLQIRFAEESFGSNKYAKVSRIDFIERKKALPESLIDEAPRLDEILIIPSYETVEEIFYGGGASDSGGDNDDEEDDRPSRRASRNKNEEDDEAEEDDRPRRRPSRDEKEEDEEEDDRSRRRPTRHTEPEDDNDDSNDDRPKRTNRNSSPPWDEVEDEQRKDNDEEDDRPRRRTRPADNEDEEEEEDERPQRSARRQRNTSKEEDECPSGHEFGKDFDQTPDCDSCPLWERCADKYEELTGSD